MAYFTTRALRAALVNITVLIIVDPHSVGIGLKEMGGGSDVEMLEILPRN